MTTIRMTLWRSLIILALALFAACLMGGVAAADTHVEGGAPGANAGMTPQQKSDFKAYLNARKAAETLDAEGLLKQHALSFGGLSYAPRDATGMDVIQGTSHALNEAELKILERQGMVISARQAFPTFTYGYVSLYTQDMPLFVSSDSILHAVHRSYDDILAEVETELLSPALAEMLQGMHSRLADAKSLPGADDTLRAELDLYLSVAIGLLTQQAPSPVAGADSARVAELISLANRASGLEEVIFFETEREMDFSQFTPRGHYHGKPALERYFRAMMWLGRIDLRLIEADHDHSLRLNRAQVNGAAALVELMDADAFDRWQRIDAVIQGFVGVSDNMTPTDMRGLYKDLGAGSFEALTKLDDDAVMNAIIAGGYGEQMISSHIVHSSIKGETMPMSSTFLIFGQRYTVDSHVFSEVVFDRMQRAPRKRMLPDPLDVAFAALGNDFAAKLLAGELKKYGYAPELEVMRSITDLHADDFWEGSLYGLWLKSLRALSPKAAEISDPKAAGLPQIAGSEAWSRRVLNTQMASWAELRHDTILYAKQSYSGVPGCEFPDAYVDPYPEFFGGIEALAHKGRVVSSNLVGLGNDALATRVDDYFTELGMTSGMLRGMAQNQREGLPHTADQLVFINNAVKFKTENVVCAEIVIGAEGWYSRLFFEHKDNLESDPTIADVHTQPADEFGAPVGKVLHVGTGMPRLAVVTIDTCDGPRAYTGLVSSYYETTTSDFKRLNDEEWLQTLYSDSRPDEVPWLMPILGPAK